MLVTCYFKSSYLAKPENTFISHRSNSGFEHKGLEFVMCSGGAWANTNSSRLTRTRRSMVRGFIHL
jgi:hypothetical protein